MCVTKEYIADLALVLCMSVEAQSARVELQEGDAAKIAALPASLAVLWELILSRQGDDVVHERGRSFIEDGILKEWSSLKINLMTSAAPIVNGDDEIATFLESVDSDDRLRSD